MVHNLEAEDAFYLPADADHPSGYLLKGMSTPKNLDAKPSLDVDGETIVFTPPGHAWLKHDECFVASNLTFEIVGQRCRLSAECVA